MSDGDGGAASNFIWAFALIVIVAILAAVLYFSGILSGNTKKDINIKVDTPATSTK